MAEFKSIQQFTKSADYVVDHPWEYFMGPEGHLKKWLSEYGLNIDPDFQRAHVWDEKKQIRYVEYVLRGGRSGLDIYFNHPGWMKSWKGEFVLVDGKQRLEAVRRFMVNEIAVFGNSFFKDFTDRMGTAYRFKVHVNDLRTRKEVLQWYIDLNAGGVAHTDEEIEKVRKMLEAENG